MRLYVRAEARASVSLLRALDAKTEAKAEAAMNAIIAHNAAVSCHLYNDIKEGFSAYQRHTNGLRLDIYHMSAKEQGIIQVSHFCLLNGKWEALSHDNITSPKNLYNALQKGCYVSILN